MEHALIELDSIDSTNTWAKKELAIFRKDCPTFITAREQTGGRGRGQNRWLSPKDQNLYLTLAEPIRPHLELAHYSQAAVFALIRILASFHITVSMKWPNDLLVGEEKICGILVEGASQGPQSWAIVGIGLNVNMDEQLLRSIDQPATSMQRVHGAPLLVEEVLQRAIEELCSCLAWAQEDPDRCRSHYLEACSWVCGRHVVLQTPQEIMEGVVERLSPEGYLLLRRADGRLVTIPQAVILRGMSVAPPGSSAPL